MDISDFSLVLLCYIVNIVGIGGSEYDAPQEIRLYHSVENSVQPNWIENGIITLQNINTGSVLVTQPSIPNELRTKVKELSGIDGVCKVKSVVKTSKGRETPFYSFFKAKTFLEAGLSTLITVYLDQNGSIIGVKANPSFLHAGFAYHNSTVHFKVIEQGPLPDTASYVLKLERERQSKEKGTTTDNRSFLAKYWMYLVPVVLFAVLSGTGNGDGAAPNAR